MPGLARRQFSYDHRILAVRCTLTLAISRTAGLDGRHFCEPGCGLALMGYPDCVCTCGVGRRCSACLFCSSPLSQRVNHPLNPVEKPTHLGIHGNNEGLSTRPERHAEMIPQDEINFHDHLSSFHPVPRLRADIPGAGAVSGLTE